MFIELTTIDSNEKVLFNTANIVLFNPLKRGTFLVDVNGVDYTVLESYEVLKSVLPTYNLCEKRKNN